MNIYQIEQDLIAIFDEIEENGGEITPELEKELLITQDAFESKIKGYVHVIKQVESDSELVDKEIKRLQALKKSKANCIKRLKQVIAFAIDQFGDTNKSGNKYYDFGTDKITVRTTQSVEVDEDTMQKAVEAFRVKLYFNKYLNTVDQLEEIDSESILEAVKNHVDEKTGLADGVDLTEEELNNISTEVTFNVPLVHLMRGKGLDIAKQLMVDETTVKYKAFVNKTSLKDVLADNPDSLEHIAKLNTNKSIIIK